MSDYNNSIVKFRRKDTFSSSDFLAFPAGTCIGNHYQLVIFETLHRQQFSWNLSPDINRRRQHIQKYKNITKTVHALHSLSLIQPDFHSAESYVYKFTIAQTIPLFLRSSSPFSPFVLLDRFHLPTREREREKW